MLVRLTTPRSSSAAWVHVHAALGANRRLVLAAIATVAVTLGFGACGSSAPSAAPPSGSSLQAGVQIPDLHLSATQLTQVEAQDGPVSAYQQTVLKDGVVTFVEYQAAVLAAVQCWQDEGLAVTGYPDTTGPNPGPVLTSRGLYEFLQSPPQGMTSQDATAKIAKCNNQYVSVLQPLWADHVAPSQQDVQAARDALGACLRGQGYDLPAHPTREDFLNLVFPAGTPADGARVEFPPGFQGCATKIDDQFGMPGFRG